MFVGMLKKYLCLLNLNRLPAAKEDRYFCNVYKSGTLLSATTKIGSEGGVPLLFVKRSDVGLALVFLRRAKI